MASYASLNVHWSGEEDANVRISLERNAPVEFGQSSWSNPIIGLEDNSEMQAFYSAKVQEDGIRYWNGAYKLT